MDGTKTRTSGRETLSSGRTAPLKPKSGLNGPPAQHFWQKRYYDSTFEIMRSLWRSCAISIAILCGGDWRWSRTSGSGAAFAFMSMVSRDWCWSTRQVRLGSGYERRLREWTCTQSPPFRKERERMGHQGTLCGSGAHRPRSKVTRPTMWRTDSRFTSACSLRAGVDS